MIERALRRLAACLIVGGNLLWSAVSILLPLAGLIEPNAIGCAFLLGQAVIAAMLAKLEADASPRQFVDI